MTRRMIAQAFVALLDRHSWKHAVAALAAIVREQRMERAIDLLINDIAVELLRQGTLYANVTSAHTLSETLKKNITTVLRQKTKASIVHIEWKNDPTLIGGIVANTPQGQLDLSMLGRLNQLNNV